MTTGSRQLKKKKEVHTHYTYPYTHSPSPPHPPMRSSSLFGSQVLGGFDETKYETVRRWASASDGTQVPISLLYRKDMVKLDGTDQCHLYGYGSYEVGGQAGGSCCVGRQEVSWV